MATIIIPTGDIREEHLSPKALTMVREWVDLNKGELLHMWETQKFKELAPLE